MFLSAVSCVKNVAIAMAINTATKVVSMISFMCFAIISKKIFAIPIIILNSNRKLNGGAKIAYSALYFNLKMLIYNL